MSIASAAMIPAPLGDDVSVWVGGVGLLGGGALWLLTATLATPREVPPPTSVGTLAVAARPPSEPPPITPTPTLAIATAPPQPCGPTLELTFEGGSAKLDDDDPVELADFVRWTSAHPDTRLVLEAFASSDGGQDVNLRLSHARGLAARRRLQERGIAAARMHVEAFGEYRSFADDSDTRDRRVIVRIDGMPACVPERKP